jgi:hypothetical protein
LLDQFRLFVFVLTLVGAACDDGPAGPDQPAVLGPCLDWGTANLAIVGFEITAPRPDLVYSGDSLLATVRIRNLGPMTSDTFGIGVWPDNPIGDVIIPRLKVDSTAVVRIKLVTSPVGEAIDSNTIRRYDAFVAGEHDPDYGNNHDTASIRYVSAHVLMSGPREITVDVPATFQVRIVNPTPNAISAATLSGCFWYLVGCLPAQYRIRVTAPTVAAHSTALVSFTTSVPRAPERSETWLPGSMVLCYGSVGGQCGGTATTLHLK